MRASVRVHRVFNFSEDILEDLQLFIFRALLDARGMEIECNSFIIHVSVRIYLSLAFFSVCVRRVLQAFKSESERNDGTEEEEEESGREEKGRSRE